jgi:hypothetical protein
MIEVKLSLYQLQTNQNQGAITESEEARVGTRQRDCSTQDIPRKKQK